MIPHFVCPLTSRPFVDPGGCLAACRVWLPVRLERTEGQFIHGCAAAAWCLWRLKCIFSLRRLRGPTCQHLHVTLPQSTTTAVVAADGVTYERDVIEFLLYRQAL